MKSFALTIMVISIILLISQLVMLYIAISNGTSFWVHLLLSIAMLFTAYSSYTTYKKNK
jgi:uncharacterized protein (DUF983 family)